jgi:hypothetical protein
MAKDPTKVLQKEIKKAETAQRKQLKDAQKAEIKFLKAEGASLLRLNHCLQLTDFNISPNAQRMVLLRPKLGLIKTLTPVLFSLRLSRLLAFLVSTTFHNQLHALLTMPLSLPA